MTRALGSSRQAILLAITVWLSTLGGSPGPDCTPIRTTVELRSTCTPAAAPPLSALETNRLVMLPCGAEVMSHGPAMLGPAMVLIGLPLSSSTIRQPSCAVADLPLVVGRLPTTT